MCNVNEMEGINILDFKEIEEAIRKEEIERLLAFLRAIWREVDINLKKDFYKWKQYNKPSQTRQDHVTFYTNLKDTVESIEDELFEMDYEIEHDIFRMDRYNEVLRLLEKGRTYWKEFEGKCEVINGLVVLKKANSVLDSKCLEKWSILQNNLLDQIGDFFHNRAKWLANNFVYGPQNCSIFKDLKENVRALKPFIIKMKEINPERMKKMSEQEFCLVLEDLVNPLISLLEQGRSYIDQLNQDYHVVNGKIMALEIHDWQYKCRHGVFEFDDERNAETNDLPINDADSLTNVTVNDANGHEILDVKIDVSQESEGNFNIDDNINEFNLDCNMVHKPHESSTFKDETLIEVEKDDLKVSSEHTLSHCAHL